MPDPAFDPQSWIDEHIPYRLTAIDMMTAACEWIAAGKADRLLTVLLGDERYLLGTGRALTNPVVEVGLMFSRALIEFLGVTVNKAGELAPVPPTRRNPNDRGIEHFPPCKRVDVTALLDCPPGRPASAAGDVLTAMVMASGGVAHMTHRAPPDNQLRAMIATGRIVMCALERYFYGELGIPVPPYRITRKTHSPALYGIVLEDKAADARRPFPGEQLSGGPGWDPKR